MATVCICVCYSLTFYSQKGNFPEGMGILIIFVENPEGKGGYRFSEKMENPGRWGVLS